MLGQLYVPATVGPTHACIDGLHPAHLTVRFSPGSHPSAIGQGLNQPISKAGPIDIQHLHSSTGAVLRS